MLIKKGMFVRVNTNYIVLSNMFPKDYYKVENVVFKSRCVGGKQGTFQFVIIDGRAVLADFVEAVDVYPTEYEVEGGTQLVL